MPYTGDYDFCGWATKNDLKCADGRIIRKGAFKVQDGHRVPLVWNHQHNSPEDTLGHAILENRDEGVYVYGCFNNSPHGQHAKECVIHGDVRALSIWANNLEQLNTSSGKEVIHGAIREVSLVHAGANPGAFIESVLSHGDPMEDFDEEGIFYTNEGLELFHAKEEKEEKEDTKVAAEEKKEESGKTVKEVYDTFNEEQKEVVAFLIGEALDNLNKDEEEEDNEMSHNIFDNADRQDENTHVLSHSDMEEILRNAKRCGSFKEAMMDFMEDNGGSVLVHAMPTTGMVTATGSQQYGFNDPDMLFPDYKALSNTPEWLSRNMDWVGKVLSAVHHTPFSRIKSMFADITEDEARARGYIKGKQKKEEVFTILKRTTTPQTIYKKQKLDRDDIIDITDFDVIAWIRAEMRVMLNEEIARAILIGDGRQTDSDDKIKEEHIRPIVKDVALFNTIVKVKVSSNATEAEIAKATINAVIRSRKNYKGSGNPTFWTTEDVTTEMLLLEDGIGHKLYKTETELATTLRAKEIVQVEPMEGHEIDIESTKYPLIGVLVNMTDYNVGTDRGGEVTMFDDFDIDYNQQKYLLETRMSGALTKPFSALTFVLDKSGNP